MVILIIFLILILFLILLIWTGKFNNPYKLILYYGKKGCGKSSMAQKIIYQHSRSRNPWHIFYNEGDSTFKQGTAIKASKLWEYEFPPRSLIIIDEVNLLWDNREFKNFPKELGQWFRLQRHFKCKVIMFSQTADADKKIRDLTDRVFLIKKYFNVLTVSIPYEKEIIYVEPKTETSISGFIDHYRKLSFGPFGCQFCWLPRWIKTHDSFKTVSFSDQNRKS